MIGNKEKLESKQYADVEFIQILAEEYTDGQMEAITTTIKMIHQGVLKKPCDIHSFFCHQSNINGS